MTFLMRKLQKLKISKVQRINVLLSGCVDVLSSEGHLNAMSAMEMSQMVVQAMWDRDSPLKQVPHFSSEVIAAVNAAGVNDVLEFIEVMSEQSSSSKLIKHTGLDNERLAEVAAFTHKYPNIDLEFVVENSEVICGQPAYLQIKLERELDDDEEEPDITVHAPYFPSKKMENWWLVVGGAANSLLAIKKITLSRKLELRLEYIVPTPGSHELTLYFMSDSYVGVDQDPTFVVRAIENMDEEDDGDNGDSENASQDGQ